MHFDLSPPKSILDINTEYVIIIIKNTKKSKIFVKLQMKKF